MNVTSPRRAASLVELLLVVGVLAALIGLLLPAIQQVRAAAARLQAANKQRHVILAAHLFADSHDGRLPGPLSATRVAPEASAGLRDYHPLYNVWNYIEGEPANDFEFLRDNGGRALAARLRGVFLSPADPTHTLLPADKAYDTCSSFSANMCAFAGQPRLATGLPDGTSSTIAYAERYAVLPPTDPKRPDAWVRYSATENLPCPSGSIYVGNYSRRATFADRGHDDVLPVTTGTPPASRASEPGVTFLCRPAYRDDYSHVLQSPYPYGLQVAFFDGSVRFQRAGISEPAFWGMVTRDGGEVIPD